MRYGRLPSLAVALWLCVALDALSQTLPADGDLLIHYEEFHDFGFSFGKMQILSSTGIVKRTVGAGTSVRDILAAPSHKLYVASAAFSGIAVYSSELDFIGSFPTDSPMHFLAMDADGILYAGAADGHVVRYRENGSVVDSFTVAVDSPNKVLAGDLAPDQCTLYYLQADSNSRVRKYDVCHRRQLPDLGAATVLFIGVPFSGVALRVANDDAVFVAGGSSVYRFSKDGVRTYPLAGSVIVAPTAEGRSFWTASFDPSETSTRQLTRRDVETGVRLSGPIGPHEFTESSIEIVGTYRASIAAGLAAIPATSNALLVALVGALLSVAMFTLRQGHGRKG